MTARPLPLESAADRLAYLQAFGVLAHSEAGDLLVIYDEPTVGIEFDEQQLNSSAPQISAPTKDFQAKRLASPRARVTVDTDDGAKDFTVREHLPDRSGWSVLVLDDVP